jgi:hypothetical protein
VLVCVVHCAARSGALALARGRKGAAHSLLVEETQLPPHFDALLQRRLPYEARAASARVL